MPATLTQCQALVAQLAAVAAQQVISSSVILRNVYREYQAAVVAAGATTTLDLTDKDGAAITPTVNELTDVTATVPVARLLANPAFFTSTVTRLAKKLADVVDTALAGTYASFTNTAVGTAGSPITDAALCSAFASLLNVPVGEPRFLALHPNTLITINQLTINASVATGGSVATSNIASGVPAKYRGMIPLPCSVIPVTGSAPATTHNLLFTPSALAFVSVQRALTNDGTHVQVYSASTDGSLGVDVYLTYNSSNDAQALGFGIRGLAAAGRANYATQVNT